jgi:hypothetical protein
MVHRILGVSPRQWPIDYTLRWRQHDVEVCHSWIGGNALVQEHHGDSFAGQRCFINTSQPTTAAGKQKDHQTKKIGTHETMHGRQRNQ